MGIDGAIKTTLLAPSSSTVLSSSWAADAWVKLRAPGASHACRNVVIDDYLIRFQSLPREGSFTLQQLFAFFWAPVQRYLLAQDSSCDTYVLICDDKRNVNKRKGPTQKARGAAVAASDARNGIAAAVAYPTAYGPEAAVADAAAAAAAVVVAAAATVAAAVAAGSISPFFVPPYACGALIQPAALEPAAAASEPAESAEEWSMPARSWQLVPGGISYTRAATSTEPAADVVEGIDLRRLRQSDPTGKRLWQAFVPYVSAAMLQSCPRGRSFVFDFCHTGALWFDSDGVVTTDVEPKHNLGEADPAVVWWMHYLRTAPASELEADRVLAAPLTSLPAREIEFHVFSTDTDLIPLYVLYHENLERDARQTDAPLCVSTDSAPAHPLAAACASSLSFASSPAAAPSLSFASSLVAAAARPPAAAASFSSSLPATLRASSHSYFSQPQATPAVGAPRVFWHFSDKTDLMVDMAHMARGIRARSGMGGSLRFFALFCIACGNCDYVPAEAKAQYAGGFGIGKILSAMQYVAQCSAFTFDRFTTDMFTLLVQRLYSEDARKIRVVRTDYSQCLSMSVLRHLNAQRKKPRRLPDDAALKHLSGEIQFNLRYWDTAHLAHVEHDADTDDAERESKRQRCDA